MTGSDHQSTVVAIHATAPEPGQVLPRLRPVLRASEAAELYGAILLDTLDVAAEACGDVAVAFRPAAGRRLLERLVGAHRRLVPQGPGDFGRRMVSVRNRLFDASYRRVIHLMDVCPAVTADTIRLAVDEMKRVDVVWGPAIPEGLFMVGSGSAVGSHLADVPWETHTNAETLQAQLDQLGISHASIEPVRGLETPSDLLEWYVGARSEEFKTTRPRTWRILNTILSPRRFARLEAIAQGRLEA